MTKRKSKKINKEEIAEDYCFKCKDGGSCRICDYRDCLKVYHPECVGKEESFLDAEDHWTCPWHYCFRCQKSSKFRCFSCPKAVCGLCLCDAEFVLIRGNKGFCNHCLKLAVLVEEKRDIDSDGFKIDFEDRETYECLFKEYWEIINEKERLSLKNLQSAKALLKKGKHFRLESDHDGITASASDEEDNLIVSDYDDIGDEEGKKKRSKKQPKVIKINEKSKGKQFIGWGSKALIEFLESIGQNTATQMTQHDVTSIIIGYIEENKLLHPVKKKKVLCDARLYSVLRRKSVNKRKIYDLLEAHFAENLVQSEEDVNNEGVGVCSSDDKGKKVLLACEREGKSISKRKSEEKEVAMEIEQIHFAAIVASNIKLVYLRRSLLEEFLKHPETFEGKVMGSFVRVKSDPNDIMKRTSHQLLQVTGIKTTLSSVKLDNSILLRVCYRPAGIPIFDLSDGDFSEEECSDLRQMVKDGLHKNLTIVELEEKARILHEDITKHWIVKELAVLQNRIDQANEKGWRRELFEYMERKQLLETSAEQSRLLHDAPKVIADIAEPEPVSEEYMVKEKQRPCGLPELNPKGASEIPSHSSEGKGTTSFQTGEGDATKENCASKTIVSSSASDRNKNGNAISSHAAEANIEDLDVEEKQHLPEELIPEKLPHIIDSKVQHNGILEEETPQFVAQENHQYSRASSVVGLPHRHIHGFKHESYSTLHNPPVPVIDQAGSKGGKASAVQIIELSDDEEESSAVVVEKHVVEDSESSIWYCVSPRGVSKGPFSLSLLKRWSDGSSCAFKFKVWKAGQSQEEAISVTDAISQILPRT